MLSSVVVDPHQGDCSVRLILIVREDVSSVEPNRSLFRDWVTKDYNESVIIGDNGEVTVLVENSVASGDEEISVVQVIVTF